MGTAVVIITGIVRVMRLVASMASVSTTTNSVAREVARVAASNQIIDIIIFMVTVDGRMIIGDAVIIAGDVEVVLNKLARLMMAIMP